LDTFSRLQTNIDGALGTYVFDVSSKVIDWLNPIFSNLLIIYIAMLGYAHLQGAIEEPLTDAFKRVVRIGLILTLALGVGTYNSLIVNFLYHGPEQVAGVMTGAAPTTTVLDNLLTQGMDIGDRAWEKGGILNGDFGQYLIAIAIYIVVALLAAYAAFLLFMSKVALALLLAIGPVFIMMSLFQTTQRFFEAWVGMTMNFALLLVLAVASVQLILSIVDGGITAVHDSKVTEISSMLTVVILVFMSGLVLRQVPSIAAALGGGLALATQGIFSRGLRGTGRVTRRGVQGTSRGVQRAYRSGKALYLRRFGNTVAGR
jgi:type IV secretion system protein VirB6